MTDPARVTFAGQASLPKLPVPPLPEVLDRYLEALATLQSPEELAVSKQCVDQFLQADGPALQKKLEEYDQQHKNYLENFWYEAYLAQRPSVVLNVNPFFVLEDDPTPSRNDQVSRAASLIMGSLQFIHALRSETLAPDTWRDGHPLCMNQYRMLFGSARMPTATKDEAFSDPTSKHIVVVCRNQFYWFDVLWRDGVTAITERELVANLEAIRSNALKATDLEAATHAVGVLTTEQRPVWAQWRAHLMTKNAQTLDIIDRALFIVCLDTTTPPDAAAFAATALHGTYDIVNGVQKGTCMNRWYDKLQIVVCQNGVAGVNFEHSFIDGHTVLRFISEVYADTIIRFAQTIRPGNYGVLQSSYRAPSITGDDEEPLQIKPRKLEWNIEPDVEEAIKFAEAKLSDLILQSELDVMEFSHFGKLFIAQHNMSPDAFVQLAIIAAYYFQYGQAPNVGELILAKQFRHGRTETVRSMTQQALTFVKTFFTTKSPIEKIAALRRAVKSQVQMVRNCTEGKSVERHLFALECMWKLQQKEGTVTPKPAIFSDIGWEKLNHTTIMTGNCGNPSVRLFGYGPVQSDGFAVGYVVKNDSLYFCATSKHRQTARFLKNLENYLLHVHSLLEHEEELRFPRTAQGEQSSTSSLGYGFFDAGAPTPAGEAI